MVQVHTIHPDPSRPWDIIWVLSSTLLLQSLPGSLVHKTTLGGLLTVTEDPMFPFASVFPEFPPEAEVTTLEPCSGCNGPILLIVGC